MPAKARIAELRRQRNIYTIKPKFLPDEFGLCEIHTG